MRSLDWTGVGVVCCLAAAAWCWPARPPVPARGWRWPRRVWLLVGLTVVALALPASGAAGSPLVAGWLAAAAVLVAAVWWQAHQHRAAAGEREGARQVLLACDTLVADLTAGAPPVLALEEASRDCRALVEVTRTARMGGDVVSGLRAASAGAGCRDLGLVAAGWEVSAASGAGLAFTLGQVADTLRARAASRRIVAAELASARATARLMACLPVLTWGLGWGTGARPWVFLFTSAGGVVCLVLGLLLAAAGVGWIDALAGRVERDS